MRIQWKKLIVLSMAATLIGVNMVSLAEESAQSRRFSVLSVSGDEAYVTRGTAKEVKATAGMPLGQGSQVRTGALTSVYVEADDDKTMKLDSNTKAEITKVSSKSLKITLKSGEMFFNVEKPLKAGEELTFDAAQTSMSIRGTSGVLGFYGTSLQFFLIEGQVQWNVGNETVSMEAGQTAVLVPDSGQVLEANGMSSAWQLQSVEGFDWGDLSPLGLEAVLEQRESLDLSAIGLGSREAWLKASQQLQEMKQEKEAKERAQKEKEEAQQREAAKGGSVRIDGKEPKVSSGGNDGGGGGGAKRETTAETMTPETTAPETTAPLETVAPDSGSGSETGSGSGGSSGSGGNETSGSSTDNTSPSGGGDSPTDSSSDTTSSSNESSQNGTSTASALISTP